MHSSDDSARGTVPLTKRQREILLAILRGESNKKIALQLRIELVTVKFHVRIILRKLGAQNRAHAVSLALAAGLLTHADLSELKENGAARTLMH